MSLDKVPVLVQACCKLHNMCVDDLGSQPPQIDDQQLRDLGFRLPPVELQGYCHTNKHVAMSNYKHNGTCRSMWRELLREELKSRGMVRPDYSTHGNNSTEDDGTGYLSGEEPVPEAED